MVTSYADAAMAHPHIARELRCYRGQVIPAARLFGAAFSDGGFVEACLLEMIERGVLRPIEYAPWWGSPTIVPSFAFGCGAGKGVAKDTWIGRRSHAMQWTYLVVSECTPPEPEVGIDRYAHWKPEARSEVARLEARRDAASAARAALDRFDGSQWYGSRRAFRRWDRARLRWVRALGAWRAVALQARNMVLW